MFLIPKYKVFGDASGTFCICTSCFQITVSFGILKTDVSLLSKEWIAAYFPGFLLWGFGIFFGCHCCCCFVCVCGFIYLFLLF